MIVQGTVRAWQVALDQMDEALAAALADAERRERAAEDAAAAPVSPAASRCRTLAGRFDERVKQLAARVAEAERSAEAVGAELAAAETDLRHWADQLAGIRGRLG
jgi:hypothetical protein